MRRWYMTFLLPRLVLLICQSWEPALRVFQSTHRPHSSLPLVELVVHFIFRSTFSLFPPPSESSVHEPNTPGRFLPLSERAGTAHPAAAVTPVLPSPFVAAFSFVCSNSSRSPRLDPGLREPPDDTVGDEDEPDASPVVVPKDVRLAMPVVDIPSPSEDRDDDDAKAGGPKLGPSLDGDIQDHDHFGFPKITAPSLWASRSNAGAVVVLMEKLIVADTSSWIK